MMQNQAQGGRMDLRLGTAFKNADNSLAFSVEWRICRSFLGQVFLYDLLFMCIFLPQCQCKQVNFIH